MGEISVTMQLENFGDRYLFLNNYIEESAIRTHTMNGIVDTGAVMLMLPQDIVERLGLHILRTAIVTYADERKEERHVAGTVTIQIGDRSMNSDCIVGPPLCEPLIGQIIMEELDLIADCKNKTLTPRPESPIYPSLKMK